MSSLDSFNFCAVVLTLLGYKSGGKMIVVNMNLKDAHGLKVGTTREVQKLFVYFGLRKVKKEKGRE